MASGSHVFTSESVSIGHPDKIADQVSDAVLDAMLAVDPKARVACETMVTTGMVVVAGEVTCDGYVDINRVVRKTVTEIGYDNGEMGFDGHSCAVLVSLDEQSRDIAQGVDEDAATGKAQGAGDQGMMFGFACRETRALMPLPIHLSHRLVERLAEARADGEIPWLRPDGKSQVTVEYIDDKPVRIDTIVISNQHSPNVSHAKIKKAIIEQVIKPVLPKKYVNGTIKYHINPTGRFVLGGPVGDCGLTGRKIIVDTYGGMGRHGGGAFSGKDPSKVDRSAAYAARHVAKNLVAAGLADRAEILVSYAIGVATPISVAVETFDTNKVNSETIHALVAKHFDLRPAAIIRDLDLRRPIYQETAAYGHFGREGLNRSWERTDKADALRKDAGL